MDEYLSKLVKGKLKKEEDFAFVLRELASPKTTKLINTLIAPKEDKKTKEKLKQYMKIYLLKNALKRAGMLIDYTELPIPINKGRL